MSKLKSINLFTQGDSTNPATWSNVPFCFSMALEKSGIKINRIDILPDNNFVFTIYKKIWNRIICKIVSFFFKENIYTIDRSLFFRFLVNRKIKESIRLYSAVDYNVFMTFSYTNIFSNIPSLLICDYTYDIYIRDKLKREPNLLEREYIKYEKYIISKSNLIVNLFPNYADIMTMQYNRKVHYIGKMGINIVLQRSIIKKDIISNKIESDVILFVGNKWNSSYVVAAKRLIEAYTLIKEKFPNVKLDIVGMDNDSFDEVPAGVTCHGLLNKDNHEQRIKYYELLSKAKIFTNTAGSYGATIEAMYYYTPVVTSRYAEFVEQFGSQISFGNYCDSLEKESLFNSIVEIIESTEYENICVLAHENVASNTWDEFSRKVIRLIDSGSN